MRRVPLLAIALTLTSSSLAAQALTTHQQLARDIYKELIEHNTSVMTSGTTMAAEAMAKRLRDAGFPAYGVSGLMRDPEDNRAHGRDERMKVTSSFDGQEFLLQLTKRLAAGRAVS